MFNIKKCLIGCLLVSAVIPGAALLPGSKADAASVSAQKSAVTQTGVIQASVRLRDKPSSSGQVIGYLKNGDKVTILESSTAYFYKVKTLSGKVGYTSSDERYITVPGKASPGSGSGSVAPSGSGSGAPQATPPIASEAGEAIERVIQTGMKYLGTPYEFGSDRNQTNTFDCSAFTRQIFKEGAGIVLPVDSRQQGAWVKQNSQAVYDIDGLKRGDLVFFVNDIGSAALEGVGADKDHERITHVAVYLGEGKLLHTYSQKAGGVVVTDFSNSWKQRFLYGGSIIR
ncbi:SH3 domain-containing C40 family peptidase [Paenibacillus sp. FSL W8-0194]|uniref:C40 family peptidase n=1 Tax=Paenibacillus sp. FSL W8-0194 TaxID=2921711 RepID=UPI0030DA39FC